MKKSVKVLTTIEAIRIALDLFKEARNLSTCVEIWEDSHCCYCDESTCRGCLCDKKVLPYDIMVELLDYDKNHIVGNWIDSSIPPSEYQYDSCTLRKMAYMYNVDLIHITCTYVESRIKDILSKTRYVRVFSRSEGETSDGEFLESNRGVELNLYGKTYSKFIQTKYWRGRRGGEDVVYEYIL